MDQRQPTTSAAPSFYVEIGASDFAPAPVEAPPTHSIQEGDSGLAGNSAPTVEALRRRIIAEITQADAVLASLLDRWSVRCLDVDAHARLAGSVAGDRDLLAGLADGARASTSRVALVEIASLVRQIRPEAYSIGVRQLQGLATLVETVEANTGRLAGLDEVLAKIAGPAGPTALRSDLDLARLLNSKAVVAAKAARDAAVMLSASSTRNEIQDAIDQALRLEILLERVDQIIKLVEFDFDVAESGQNPGA